MSLSKLLRLQLFYPLTGMLFNLVSLSIVSNGGEQLTPTVPSSGMIAMSIYGFFLLSGYFKQINLYRILMFISILLLGYGGVVSNVIQLVQSPELYHSIWVGMLGLSINLYGLVLNIIAAIGKFRLDG